jgi:hypothetical protein
MSPRAVWLHVLHSGRDGPAGSHLVEAPGRNDRQNLAPAYDHGREFTVQAVSEAEALATFIRAHCRTVDNEGLRHFACLRQAASNPNTRTKHQNLAKRLARERAARIIAGAGQQTRISDEHAK